MQIRFTVLKSFLIMVDSRFWCAWCFVDLHTHGVLVECVVLLLCLCLYIYHFIMSLYIYLKHYYSNCE
jgi:hypothetical protein